MEKRFNYIYIYMFQAHLQFSAPPKCLHGNYKGCLPSPADGFVRLWIVKTKKYNK